MTVETARTFTLKRLVLGDMLLNWFLGAVLALAPRLVDNVLGYAPLLSTLIYRVIGIGFLGFAAWQTWIVIRQDIRPGDLVFAGLMAEGPVILLTIALLFLPLALRPGWRIVLWAGDVYMLLLGVWYIFLARWLLKSESRHATG